MHDFHCTVEDQYIAHKSKFFSYLLEFKLLQLFFKYHESSLAIFYRDLFCISAMSYPRKSWVRNNSILVTTTEEKQF